MNSDYSYIISKIAKKDMRNTINYITNKLCNKDAAQVLFNNIKLKISDMCKNPMASSNCEIYDIYDDAIRHCNVENFVLIFKIEKENKRIDILRFLHSKRNITEIIKNVKIN